jgi:hypothetical protein
MLKCELDGPSEGSQPHIVLPDSFSRRHGGLVIVVLSEAADCLFDRISTDSSYIFYVGT